MSTQAISSEAMPPGEASAMARVRQLQELIQQAQTGVSPSQRAPEAQGGFSTALAQASAQAPVAYASSTPGGGRILHTL